MPDLSPDSGKNRARQLSAVFTDPAEPFCRYAVCAARSTFDDDDSFDGAEGDFGRSNPLIL